MSFRKSLTASLGVGLVFVLLGICYAQLPSMLGTAMPQMYGEFEMAKVGSYVEYSLVSKISQDEETLRLAIVDEEKTPEGKLYWYEIKSHNRNTGETAIIKTLISGDPKEWGNIKRMIIKHNQERALELPASLLAMAGMQKEPEKPAEGKKEEKAKELGKEKIKTPAGNFNCVHLRYQEPSGETVDAWTSKEVPFFGLAKFKSKYRELEILSYGDDAVSDVTEEPEQIPSQMDTKGTGK